MPPLKTLDASAVKQIKEALEVFHDQVGEFLQNAGDEPLPDSLAANEISSYARIELLNTVYSQGTVLIEVAADFLMGFCKVLVEPVQTIVPWSSVRGVLEASSISAWLLDPEINPYERVGRSFAFRYDGLYQQLKFARSTGEKDMINTAEMRIEEVESNALDLGYKRILNSRHKRVGGIGQRMPSITLLIARVLNKEPFYRLLSAMTHAHPWALQQLGFKAIRKNRQSYFEKHLNPISVCFLGISSVEAFSVPLKNKAKLFGWEFTLLEQMIHDFTNVLGAYDFQASW